MRLLSLTKREWDVLTELCRDGATNRVIGKRLHITEDTVKSHVKSLLLKSHFATRTELAVAVVRQRVALACDVPVRRPDNLRGHTWRSTDWRTARNLTKTSL